MTRYLFTLDPGVKAAGVAVFDLHAKTLVGAGLARGETVFKTAQRAIDMAQAISEMVNLAPCFPSEVIVEKPQVYVRGKGDPNDLIEVALSGGAFAGWFYMATQTAIQPREWKGQVNPDAMIERIKSRLSPEETARVEIPRAKSLAHNIFDAVGIGLHRLGRLR